MFLDLKFLVERSHKGTEDKQSCSLLVENLDFVEQFGVTSEVSCKHLQSLFIYKTFHQKIIELVFQDKSGEEVKLPSELVTAKPDWQTTEKNYTNTKSKIMIGSHLKKYARIGVLEDDNLTLTDCDTGEPMAGARVGVDIVTSILYVSDPGAISSWGNRSYCLPGYLLILEKGGTQPCHSMKWCAEYETESACQDACHAVTGDTIFVE